METFLVSLVALLVILDPIGTAAVFVGITPRDSEARRRSQAIRATLISVVVLTGFAFLGEFLLRAMDITLPAFQIAGGLLLFVLAFDMVMQRPSGLRATESERSEAEASDDDVSVFPLAIPLIAGPGAMTSVVLLRGRAGDDPAQVVAVLAALLVALAIMLACLLAAGTMTRIVGKTGTHVIGRVLGVVLAALSAQLVIDGIRAGFGFA
ncbi:MAG: MarC family protein [Burkholderiales bacterium]|jgi:multiple antibiotic resistance protein|nr:MarC family protein [Burkholderiales bacterium]